MKILFITLSNIGDCILTLPVLDYLRKNFSPAEITVMVGLRPKELFEHSPAVKKVIVYDKHAKLKAKIKLLLELKKEKFDCIVDLRNTLYGAFLPAKFKTTPFKFIPAKIMQMKDRHLYKVKSQKPKVQNSEVPRESLYTGEKDKEYIEKLLKENNIAQADKIICFAPGARSDTKRWEKEKFVTLIERLLEKFAVKIVLLGGKEDIPVNKYILERLGAKISDFSDKTSFAQLAWLLGKSDLLITNDSAVMHMASYLNKPVVAVFGPTDDAKYGPWSQECSIVKKETYCRPCSKAQCKFNTLECMRLVKVEDVLRAAEKMLGIKMSKCQSARERPEFKRILIVRTDRIGDVVLSTPVIESLREAYPNSFIAMMVSAATEEIAQGNPFLDSVIVYDKKLRHKSWFSSLKFALKLREKKFDLAIILHPTNRVHLVTFLAGIAQRLGYNRKLSFLLTKRLLHRKELGERHESEYNLDLLRMLGIEPGDKKPYMPITDEARRWLKELFLHEGVGTKERLLVVHPGASCPSKLWPAERFARVADRFTQDYAFKVLVVSGAKDTGLAKAMIEKMRHQAINLAGRISLKQLAALLQSAALFISNDSGPVHIACAVKTPVIAIFGRKEKGLGPLRWGPLGERSKALHKDVGCQVCLAHNCRNDFACLKAITVEDVLAAADSLLQQ